MTNFADGADKFLKVLLDGFAQEEAGNEAALRQGVVDLVMMEIGGTMGGLRTLRDLALFTEALHRKSAGLYQHLKGIYGQNENFGKVFTDTRYGAFIDYVGLTAGQLNASPVILNDRGEQLWIVESAEDILARLHKPAPRIPVPAPRQQGRIILAR